MKKFNFDIRQILIYTVSLSGMGCLALTALFGFGCKNQMIAGLNGPYGLVCYERKSIYVKSSLERCCCRIARKLPACRVGIVQIIARLAPAR